MKTLRDVLTIGTVLPTLMMPGLGQAASTADGTSFERARSDRLIVAQVGTADDPLHRKPPAAAAPPAARAPAPPPPVHAPSPPRSEQVRPPAPPQVHAPAPPRQEAPRPAAAPRPQAPVEARPRPEKHVAPPPPTRHEAPPPEPRKPFGGTDMPEKPRPPVAVKPGVPPHGPDHGTVQSPGFGTQPKPPVVTAPVAPKPPSAPTADAPPHLGPAGTAAPHSGPSGTAAPHPGPAGTALPHPGPTGPGAPPHSGAGGPPVTPGVGAPPVTPGVGAPQGGFGVAPPPVGPGAPRPLPPQGDARPQPGPGGPRPGGVGAAVGAAAVGAAVGVVGGMMLGGRADGLDDVRRQRHETMRDGATVYSEPGRVIVRDQGGLFLRHDETERFRGLDGEVTDERRGDETYQVWRRPDGVRIVTVTDPDGRLLRRIRRWPDGREEILIDNTRRSRGERWSDEVVVLPPPETHRRWYIETEQADETEIYDMLAAEPLAPLPRRYSLDEVRASRDLRAYMPAVDVDTVNFDTGSWTVEPDQIPRLAVVADSIKRILARSPDEIFLVEGHTDAVGSDIDNLSLSDRRAESVAQILTRNFGVPPENLTTQGYGEQILKEPTDGPSRINRRVTVRRITPLLETGAR